MPRLRSTAGVQWPGVLALLPTTMALAVLGTYAFTRRDVAVEPTGEGVIGGSIGCGRSIPVLG